MAVWTVFTGIVYPAKLASRLFIYLMDTVFQLYEWGVFCPWLNGETHRGLFHDYGFLNWCCFLWNCEVSWSVYHYESRYVICFIAIFTVNSFLLFVVQNYASSFLFFFSFLKCFPNNIHAESICLSFQKYYSVVVSLICLPICLSVCLSVSQLVTWKWVDV